MTALHESWFKFIKDEFSELQFSYRNRPMNKKVIGLQIALSKVLVKLGC